MWNEDGGNQTETCSEGPCEDLRSAWKGGGRRDKPKMGLQFLPSALHPIWTHAE